MRRFSETVGFIALVLSPRRDQAHRVYELLSTHNNFAENSLFLNSGYWEKARTYDEACEALAVKLAELAGLDSQDRVLDVGPGFGDQDMLWRARFGCREIVGVNVCEPQIAEASRRVAAAGEAGAIRYLHGSATAMSFEANTFDKVLALESAFHFNTRETFFREAFRVLKPGGVLALADVIPDEDASPNWLQNFVMTHVGSAFWQMPQANWYGRSAYRDVFAGTGFEEVRLTSIADKVFPGYHANVGRRIDAPEIRQRVNPLLRAMWKAGKGVESRFLDYILAVGRKPL